MTLLAAVRLVSYLNAAGTDPSLRQVAPLAVRGEDVAHHVVDPRGLIGGPAEGAVPLADVFETLLGAGGRSWLLALPDPGRLAPLRGPPELVRAALATGVAAVAATGALALVPYRVGPAVQWLVLPAEPPAAIATGYEAERELSETVLRAAAELGRLDVAGGQRPGFPGLELAPGTPARQRAAADRAVRLRIACTAALAEDGTAISAYEADRRRTALRDVREAAGQALSAALRWPGAEGAGR